MVNLGSYSSRDNVKINKKQRDEIATTQTNQSPMNNSVSSRSSTPLSNPTAPTKANAAKLGTSNSVQTIADKGVVSPDNNPNVKNNLLEQVAGVITNPVPGLVKSVANPFGTGGMVDKNGVPIAAGTPPMIGPAGLGTGLKTAVSAIKAASGKSALNAGGWTIGKAAPAAKSTAENIGKNTKTAKETASFLSKLVTKARDPSLVVGGLMGAIGSYPFAGFIKEESLQTSAFAVSSALANNDLASAEEAIAFQKELLDPDLWNQIKASVPYLNVVNSLSDYYSSARLKLAVDERVIADKKQQLESGESDTDYWRRVNQEKFDMELAVIDYYNEERKKLLNWEEEAKDRDMVEDAAFWAKERKKTMDLEAEERKAIAEFWTTYRKQMQKYQEDSRPSKFNFGLI